MIRLDQMVNVLVVILLTIRESRYQAESKIPLLICIDGEWGLGMRLDSTMEFPKQMSLGAIRDNDVIYRMGAEIGRQCQRLGIQRKVLRDPFINGQRAYDECLFNV
jgi:beta-glucosidase-like glycosyl hydrolase